MIEISVTGFKEGKEAAKRRIQGSTQRWKSKETDSLLSLEKAKKQILSSESSEGTISVHLGFIAVRLISDFWPLSLQENTFGFFFFLNH